MTTEGNISCSPLRSISIRANVTEWLWFCQVLGLPYQHVSQGFRGC